MKTMFEKSWAACPGISLFHDFTPALAEKLLFRYYYLDKLSYNYCKSLFSYRKSGNATRKKRPGIFKIYPTMKVFS